MTFTDFVFLAFVIGLPSIVSARLFAVEPMGRPYLLTYLLAVFGTAAIFAILALVLMITGLNSLGMFDGIYATIAAVPIALVVGIVIRARHRNGKTLNS